MSVARCAECARGHFCRAFRVIVGGADYRGVCILVLLSRYMRPEGPWQRLRRCPRATAVAVYIYGFDPPYPVFFSKVPGYPAKFLCPTMPRVLARDCPPLPPPFPPHGQTPSSPQHHLHRPPSTTCTTSQRPHRRQVIPVSDLLHRPSACNTVYTTRRTSYTTGQRPSTLPTTRNTTRRKSLALPVSDHVHYYPMATIEDSEPEVELQVAVTRDTEPGPGPDALILGQHFATYIHRFESCNVPLGSGSTF